MKRSVLAAVLSFLALASVVGCSSSASSDGGGDKKYRVAVIPKGTTHEFWRSVHAGAQQAADELGNVEVLWKGPLQESDRDGQITVVQDFITNQVDGICLAPLDSQALVGPVREAKRSGIPTVVFDSGLSPEADDDIVSYVATDNYNGGVVAARRLGDLLKKQDSPTGVILLRYNPGSESTEQREEGFLATLKEEYPDVPILSSDQYSRTTPEEALNVSQQLLSAFRDEVGGVFAVCEPNSTGMLGAIEDEPSLSGKVKFIAFDPNSRLIQGMEEGTVHGIVLQDPVTMGYLAVKTMVAHLEGEPVEKRVSTGEFVATPENMAEQKMNSLLHPVQYGD